MTSQLDLAIAIGSSKPLPPALGTSMAWTEDRKVGLFLQEKENPGRVYALGVKAGFPDCAARVERVTPTDTVISCEGEKSDRFPNQKWIYDVRTKRLLHQFSWEPFAMDQVLRNVGGAIFQGSDGRQSVSIRYLAGQESSFRVTTGPQPEPRPAAPPAPLPRLPRTSYDQFAAARPQRVKNGYTRASAEIHDSAGPWQREGSLLWFGKTFYDGEGSTGVGGFGYFDSIRHKFQIFSPPQIADWSVSAIDISPEYVWLALVQNGEYGGSAGGLLRYDRQSGEFRHFELPDIAVQFLRLDGKLLAATSFGIALVDAERVTRYFVDCDAQGHSQISAATR